MSNIGDGSSAGLNGLLPFHVIQLRNSAISDEVIAARGYLSVSRPTPGDQSPKNLLKRLGIPGWARNDDARFPGLLIPQYRATGEPIGWQYRPDSPPKDPKTGKVRKYASQVGRASVIDVHPRWHNDIIDPTVDLWITEGIKKADCLTSLGHCTIALAGVYNWRGTHGSLGDWEDIPLKGRRVYIAYDSDALGNPNVGRAMGRLGAWLKSKGAHPTYVIPPPAFNGKPTKGIDDYLGAGGTLELLWQQGGASLSPPAVAENPLVDVEGWMVDQLAEDVLDGRWQWTAGLGWLRYSDDTGRWEVLADKDVAVQEETRRWLKVKHLDATEALTQAARRGAGTQELARLEALASAWRAACTHKRITNLAALARGLVQKDAAEFDAHPDLLNCPNGVADLRTGQLLDHNPELYFTKVTRARYVPGATHPDWDKALEAIPADVLPYGQLRYGQAVTGHKPPDDVILIEVGTGENGKSTIKGGIKAALGVAGNHGTGYIAFLSSRVLMADENAHPTEIMDLRGARIGVLEETPEDHRLRTTRLKLVTGDTVTARLMRENTATFDNGCSIIVSTNYRPVVTETDNGTWRRLLALDYPFRFRKPHEKLEGEDDRRGDPGLRERVRSGDGGIAEAVLTWLVAGAVRWYAGEAGRDPMTMGEPPVRVMRDTGAWRAACDQVLGYAAEHLVFDPKRHIPASELTDDINSWLLGSGHREWSDRIVQMRFSGHEVFTSNRVSRGRKYSSEEGISRRPGYETATLPVRFHTWLGVRFRTRDDDIQEMQQDGVFAAQPEYGTGGTGYPVNAPKQPLVKGSTEVPSHPSRDDTEPDFAVLYRMADHSARVRD